MKKGFTLVELISVIVLLALILLLVFPSILSFINNTEKDLSKATEKIILTEASQYVTDNINDYPTKSGAVYCLSLENLINKNYLDKDVVVDRDINNIIVKIEIVNKKHKFSMSDRTCTQNLIAGDSILDKAKNIVYERDSNFEKCKSDDTTYQYMGGCYIKGDSSSNYVWYSGFTWRIMGINADNSVKLILAELATSMLRDNSPTNYFGSSTDKWLNEYFLSNLKNTEIILDSEFCEPVASQTINIDSNCTGIKKNRKVGLITATEYTLSLSNTNSTFLDIQKYYSTLSSYDEGNIWQVWETSEIMEYSRMSPVGIRPIINVYPRTIITGGSGTSSDIYFLNDNKINVTNQSLNMAKVSSGEYIKLGTKIYRIVSTNKEITKLILNDFYDGNNNGIYDESDKYMFSLHDDCNDFNQSELLTFLNTTVLSWLGDSKVQNKIIPSNWYQTLFGLRIDNFNYVNALDETNIKQPLVNAKVGLIRVTEMLSSPLVTNRTIKGYYWTISNSGMSLSSDNCGAGEWTIKDSGLLNIPNTNTKNYIRPVINISSQEIIKGGIGLLSNPYIINLN